MKILAEAGAILAVHAENNALVSYLEQEMRSQGRCDPHAHMEARSPLAESMAIEQAISLARDTGAALHVAHLTIASGAERIAHAKSAGYSVSVETCPSYLLMNSDDYLRMGPRAKCLPPLRSRENVEELWEYVQSEKIDCFASDHAPYTQEAVEKGWEDIWQAPNGICCNQVMLPLLLDEAVNKRDLSLDAFARLSATHAARRFGLYPKKGTILPGSDADLAIYDLHSDWVVDEKRLFNREKRTPYHGWRCGARLERTIVRGMTVFDGNEILVPPGYGEFIVPLKREEPRV
jgi:dihydroorotase-like cyclic amidohydrolase